MKRLRFQQQKSRAKDRGIPFLLTFAQWLDIWQTSGHLHERGVGPNQYVMARFGDTGPYSLANVKIITTGDNARDVEQTSELRRLKGAHAVGKPSNNRKLKDHEVLAIRKDYRYRSTTHGAPALAKKYGVHFVTVWEALHGQGWASV